MKRSADPNSDKLKTEFRQKLENFESAPSTNLWDRIELSLDKEEAQVYKNRMRIYARLAAACLLLLLAFGVVFIPQKLEQLKGDAQEMAVSGNSGKNNPNAARPAVIESGITAGNISDKHSNSASEIPSETRNSSSNIALKPAANSFPAAKNKASEKGFPAEKTVAFAPEKVNIQAAITSANPASPLAFNTEPSVTKTTKSELAETAEIKPEPAGYAIAAISETSGNEGDHNLETETSKANPGVTSASNLAAAKTAEKSAKNPDPALPTETASVAIASARSQARTFSVSNPTVSDNAATRENLPYLESKTSGITAPENAALKLPETTLLATVAASENEKPADPEKPKTKTNRWMLTAGYAARAFNSGMRLASHARPNPDDNYQPIANQEECINQYEGAIREFNHNTRSAYSQGAALTVGYKFSERWAVQTGLAYAQNREQTESSYLFEQRPPGSINTGLHASDSTPQTTLQTVLENSFNPATTQIIKTAPGTTQYTFEHFSVPVNLRFQTNHQAFYYFAAAGVSINLLTNTVIETENEQITMHSANFPGSKAETTSFGVEENTFRTWLPAVHAQTGIGYHLTERWHTELALEGNQFLKPLIANEATAGAEQRKPKSLGATLNFGYTF